MRYEYTHSEIEKHLILFDCQCPIEKMFLLFRDSVCGMEPTNDNLSIHSDHMIFLHQTFNLIHHQLI